MHAGLCLLRLDAACFWAMTPRELAAAIRFAGGGAAVSPPMRAEFDRLMAAFPDVAATMRT